MAPKKNALTRPASLAMREAVKAEKLKITPDLELLAHMVAHEWEKEKVTLGEARDMAVFAICLAHAANNVLESHIRKMSKFYEEEIGDIHDCETLRSSIKTTTRTRTHVLKAKQETESHGF
jgi:hypothetical protein